MGNKADWNFRMKTIMDILSDGKEHDNNELRKALYLRSYQDVVPRLVEMGAPIVRRKVWNDAMKRFIWWNRRTDIV